MPNKGTHLIVGYSTAIGFCILLNNFLNWDSFIVIIIATYFFSQLPDLDQPGSIIRRQYNYLVFSICALAWVLYTWYQERFLYLLTAIGILSMYINYTTHRSKKKGLHKIWFIALCAIPFFLFNITVGSILFLVALSHLLIDGVKLWRK